MYDTVERVCIFLNTVYHFPPKLLTSICRQVFATIICIRSVRESRRSKAISENGRLYFGFDKFILSTFHLCSYAMETFWSFFSWVRDKTYINISLNTLIMQELCNSYNLDLSGSKELTSKKHIEKEICKKWNYDFCINILHNLPR